MWFERSVDGGFWRTAVSVLAALLLVFCLAGLLASSAWPRMHHPARGHRIMAAGELPPVYPLDEFTNPSGAYSFRRLKTAYSGPAVRIRRASDNTETDINFLGYVPGLGAPWDEVAANTFCAATTCTVAVKYDQSGNGRHLVQATDGLRPLLMLGGTPNGLAHMRQTSAAMLVQSTANFTPATGIVTISVVARRNSGTGVCAWFRQNGALNRLQSLATINWSLVGGAGGSVARFTVENAWQAATGVMDGAASVLHINLGETAGTATGSTTAGLIQIAGGAASNCDNAEEIFWDNYALPPAERLLWVNNQKSFWGF